MLSQKQMSKWVKQTARVPRGYLRYQVLMMLKEKPMSGSEIAEQIENETDGEYRPGSGSLYPVLKKLNESGFTEKLPVEDGVYRYRLTERGTSFFDEHYDVMQEVRKKLDAVEFPFTSLFQSNPQFRTYFMRITKVMTAISEFLEMDSNPELVKRIEKVVSRSADELEVILKTINLR
ncbi:MAG: PadR family transcriptional regulator [Candidatus Thorarchaeota archaeon]